MGGFSVKAAEMSRRLRELAWMAKQNALVAVGNSMHNQKVALASVSVSLSAERVASARVRLCNGQLDNEKSLDGTVRRIQRLYRADRL